MGAFFPVPLEIYLPLNLSLFTDWKKTQLGKASKCSTDNHKITIDIPDHCTGFREGRASHCQKLYFCFGKSETNPNKLLKNSDLLELMWQLSENLRRYSELLNN